MYFGDNHKHLHMHDAYVNEPSMVGVLFLLPPTTIIIINRLITILFLLTFHTQFPNFVSSKSHAYKY